MRFEGYNDEVLDEEEILDEFLGENPRARELRLMRGALEQRRSGFTRDRERSQDERERTAMAAKITELDRQIAAIRQEEEITTFVEGSVRLTLNKPSCEELD